jgi:VanZ family protein
MDRMPSDPSRPSSRAVPPDRFQPSWLRAWGPVGLMMAILFVASTDLGRTENSSWLIRAVAEFFLGEVSDATFATLVFLVRKSGHLTGYAVLGALVFRARSGRRSEATNFSSCVFAVAFAALYAMADEYHQSFNPHRSGQWSDVAIDTVGAALGVAVLRGLRRRNGIRGLP